ERCNKVVETNFYSDNQSRIEWNDMNSLLLMAKNHGADWILFMDADETFEPRLKTTIRDYINNPDVGMYKFRRYWLWNTAEQYRVDQPEKFSSLAYNSYLVRSTSALHFPNPAGTLWKRLIKHLQGKEKLRPYFGREPITGIAGNILESDIVLLHHAALNWNQFVKNQMWYGMMLAKRQPNSSESDLSNQLYSILDESTLELKPINKDWL
ncbi:MAG: hypothetical protein AAEA79_00570, partial [Nitrososphaerales archaeon]